MTLYELKYDLKLEGKEQWLPQTMMVVSSDDAAAAIREMRDAAIGHEQLDGGVKLRVVGYILRSCHAVCKVDMISVPSLIAEGILDVSEPPAPEDIRSNMPMQVSNGQTTPPATAQG